MAKSTLVHLDGMRGEVWPRSTMLSDTVITLLNEPFVQSP